VVVFVVRSVLCGIDFKETICFIEVYYSTEDVDICMLLHVINFY